MGLEEYQRKRDFTRTPEPRGGEQPGETAQLRFVIQKHAARRLHYDFRLELGGTLKSWAVPKGPSLDPSEKRLAVHVEDHPLEYRDFEGVIPKAQYGGGTVMLWDEGHWYPEGDPERDYRRGRLRFRLEGRKLHGSWHLVRSGGRAEDRGRENWLLIKAHDEYSREGEDVLEQALSVATGRTLDEIAAERDRVWRSGPQPEPAPRARRPRHSRGARTALPDALAPQLATLVDAVPAGSEWLHEIKYDGYRILARLAAGEARLFSRNGKDWTERFPRIARALAALPLRDGWFDGEVASLLPDGRSSFQALQGALSEGQDAGLVYQIFDLMFADGEDLRGRPLLERKRRLAESLAGLGGDSPLRYCDHMVGHGQAFYQQACDYGLEGTIAKRADLPYRSGRSRDWLKLKCLRRQEFVIVGYTEPRGSRRHFGALLLGVHEAGGLRYAGRVGTGFDQQTLSRLGRRLAALRTASPPLDASGLPAEAVRGARWVRPELVAEVAFTDWTREGVLRHPSYQGLREDKPSAEVVRERAAPPPEEPARGAGSAPPADAVAGIRLSKPDKVLFPEQGLSKRELAAYYEAVADWLLPQAADRPLTLLRCPDGRHRQCFYQKHAGEGTPEALRRVSIPEKGKEAEYLAFDSLAGLIALVQMGVLEIHVRGARTDRLNHPDRLVFDFDPDEGQPWSRVVLAAQRMRAELAELGLESYVRTTGGKGLHVVMPLVRRHDWDEAKRFSRAVAERMARRYRGEYTVQSAKAARRGKIFIDYLRNSSGATAVASYSTRARPHATVATPIAWEELEAGVDPGQFTVRSVPERLRGLERDPWEGLAGRRQSITRAMREALGLA